MSVANFDGDTPGLVHGYQSGALFYETCTGSCDAGSIPAAGVGCIASQPTTETNQHD